jgi:hypothetical protein
LSVPFIQKLAGFRNIYIVFLLHYSLQVVFHRNLNRIVARHFMDCELSPGRWNHILIYIWLAIPFSLRADKPRTRLSSRRITFTKIGGMLGVALRASTRKYLFYICMSAAVLRESRLVFLRSQRFQPPLSAPPLAAFAIFFVHSDARKFLPLMGVWLDRCVPADVGFSSQ